MTTTTSGEYLKKLGTEATSRSPSSKCFQTSGGSLIAVAANNERQFFALCNALGHPEWRDDPRWSDFHARETNQEELRKLFAEVFSCRTAEEWEKLLEIVGVPAARVRAISDVVQEGQLEARGLLKELIVGDNETKVQIPAIGFQLNGDSLQPRRPPRTIGQDNSRWLNDQ